MAGERSKSRAMRVGVRLALRFCTEWKLRAPISALPPQWSDELCLEVRHIYLVSHFERNRSEEHEIELVVTNAN